MSRLQLKLCLLATTLAAGIAQAQTSLPPVGITASRVTIKAPPPRVDVSQVCAGFNARLREELRLPAVEQAQDILVRFRLSDGQVAQVGTRHAPVEWRHTIRRAVRTVDCKDDGQANQQFAFIVRVLPEHEGAPEAVALQADSPLLVALND
jgi:hypothetical protein